MDFQLLSWFWPATLQKKKKIQTFIINFQNTYFSVQIWASAFVFAYSQENEQDTFNI